MQVLVTGIHGARPYHGIVPDDGEAVLFVAVWFLVFYSKANLLVSSRLGLLVVSLMSAVGWARAVMWQLDAARGWYPGQLLPPLLSATCVRPRHSSLSVPISSLSPPLTLPLSCSLYLPLPSPGI